MFSSRTFGKRPPPKGHQSRGQRSVRDEVDVLRREVDSAFAELERVGQLAAYTVSTADPTASDDSTEGFTVFSRWINTTPVAREFVCLDPTPGAAYWQETTNTVGGGIIPSVFGRAGNILASAGDYDASQIENDSGVPGDTVKEALESLLATIPAPSAVSSIFGRKGDVVVQSGDYTSSLVSNNSSVPGSTVSDALDRLLLMSVSSAVMLEAGAGLVGGGDLSAHRVFGVGANPDGSIIVNKYDVQVGVLATDEQHGLRGGANLHENATPVSSGFLSFLDKAKLDSIAHGAQVNTVASAFGRVGRIVAALNDYRASLIENDSFVDGQTVKDALDRLKAAMIPMARQVIAGAGLTGGGDLSADRILRVFAHSDKSIVVANDGVKIGVLATDAQHGVRGGGTQHVLASSASAGFMSPQDKIKLDGLEKTLNSMNERLSRLEGKSG